ncbi:MAG: O-antigen ligase family protein [Actinomycetota bacterium]
MAKTAKKQQKKSSPPVLRNQFDQWVLYGFLAIAVALPLAMSRITYDQFDIAKILSLRILTLIIVVFWSLKMLSQKKHQIRWSKLDFFVLAFLVLGFISTITSIHIPTSIHGKYKRFEGLLTFLNYGILYFLALQTFTSFSRLSKLSKTLTIAGGVVAFYGVLQYVGVDIFSWATLPFEERRSFSTFGNPDLLAGFIVILVPIALAEFLKARKVESSILTGAIFFISFVCLLTAFTRGAWIGALVALITFAITGFKEVLSNKRKIAFVLAAIIGVFSLIAIYSASSGHDVLNLIERLKSTTKITEGSAGNRLEIWKAGIKMIKARPILGLGPDTYRLGSEHYETLKYVKMGAGKTVADNAHNYVIQLAAGVGIPATAIFIIFFIGVVATSLRYSLKLKGDDRLTYVGLVCAAIGYAVHLIFGVSVSGSTGIFWIIIGALVAASPIVKSAAEREGDLLLKAAMAALSLVALVSAYYAMSLYVGDYYNVAAIKSANTGNLQDALNNFERAIRLYPNGRFYDNYGLCLERFGVGLQDRNLIEKAVAIYNAGKEFEPREGDHYIFLASALSKLITSPQDENAKRTIEAARSGLKIRPYSVAAREILGNVLFFQGKYKDAIKNYELALTLDPTDPSTNKGLARCYEKLGDSDKAREYYEKLLALTPDDQEAKDALARLVSGK